MDHTVRFEQSRSYVDVCGVWVCAIPFEMVCLLCVGSVVYWSVWVFDRFQGVGAGGLGVGVFMGGGFSGGCQRR